MTEVNEELNNETTAPESKEELNTAPNAEEPNAPEVQEGEDYKAELERVTQERDNYKEGLLVTKDKLKKEKEKTSPTPPELNIDEIKDSIRQDAVDDTIEDVLDGLSTNEDEKKLIKHHYSRLQKTGYSKTNIIKDLEDAKLLANSKKIFRENEELRNSSISRQSISNSGAGSSIRRDYEPDVKLTPAEEMVMKRVNANRVSQGLDPISAKEALGK